MSQQRGDPGGALVVFDLDGTLTHDDTYVAFLLAVLRQRPLRLIGSWRLVLGIAAFKLRLRDNGWLKTLFLRTICAGCDRRFVDALAQRFADRVVRQAIKPGAETALREHLGRGDRVALATASLDLYAVAVAGRLGLPAVDVLATRAEWRDDRLTGRLRSANLYGQAKADAVAQWAGSLGRERVDVAYSDHHSDLPLLRGAVRGVAVDPTPELRALAGRYGLHVASWRTTGGTDGAGRWLHPPAAAPERRS